MTREPSSTPSPAPNPVSRPTRRSVLLGGAAATLAGSAGPLLWVPPSVAAGRVTPATGVHLMYGAKPRHQMALSWSTPTSVRKPRLELGKDNGYGLDVVGDSRSSLRTDSVYHHVSLRHLEPDTTYHYRISHAGSAKPYYGTFTTAPTKARRFRFAAFGDMGVNADGATHVKLIRQQKCDFAFMTGDLSYADSSGGTGAGGPDTQDFALWDRWLRQIQPSAAHVPWMTTVGNHEMEEGNGELGYDGYLARFELPGNGVAHAPVTYHFTYGNVGFVVLDGNDASYEIARNQDYLGAAQDRWLTETLKRFRADPAIDFVVAGFHNCMYCTNLVHGSDGGNRSRWEPIFDAYSVDLVVNGHNHCYERTHTIRGGQPVEAAAVGSTVDSSKGTTYLTAGGAGQTAYPSGGLPTSYVVDSGGTKVPEATTYSAIQYNDHSLAFVDVTPRDRHGVATMRLYALKTDGTRIDAVTMRRTRA